MICACPTLFPDCCSWSTILFVLPSPPIFFPLSLCLQHLCPQIWIDEASLLGFAEFFFFLPRPIPMHLPPCQCSASCRNLRLTCSPPAHLLMRLTSFAPCFLPRCPSPPSPLSLLTP